MSPLFLPRPSVLLLATALLPIGAWAQQAPTAPATPSTPTTPPTPVTPSADSAQAADDGAARLERVEITGTAVETAVRRESTAAKTIIGRDELDRYADQSVAEVLKRLPGVTLGGRPGRGGAVRMRGLGSGYTQILINGERLGAGLSLDDLTPEQLERIEVLRAPTAETGAQAIAGTINIILREDVRKRLNNVNLGLSDEDGHLQPSANWSRSDQIGDVSYNFNAHLMRSDRLSTSQSRTQETRTPLAGGAEVVSLDRTDQSESRDWRNAAHLGGRLQWKLGGGDTLALMPFAILSSGGGQTDGVRQVDAGTSTFDATRQQAERDYRLLRLNGQWNTRLDGGARLETRAGLSRSNFDGDSRRVESLGGIDNRAQQDLSLLDEQWWSAGGKYTRNLGADHQLAAGWELERGQRDDGRSSIQTVLPAGTSSSLLADFGENLSARTTRSAAWAQDEWSITGQWAVHGGLRWEGITTRSDLSSGAVNNRSQVLSPLLHAIYRLEEGGRDQIRASLTRSYRAPTLQNIAARPSINSSAPVNTANSASTPDRAGNPDIRPELATGLDIAFERYLDGGGVLSASVFRRQIQDLIRNQTQLETVSWSSVPRHVSRPQNVGDATTQGIELEAKFRLDEAVAQATPVDLRINGAVFRSRVEDIAGPDNRLDQQPGWTAGLGADYRLRGLPLTIGGHLALTPAYAVQQSASQRSTTDARRVLDAYALWRFSPAAQLRLSASNLVPRDETSTTAVASSDATDAIQSTTTSFEPSRTSVSLRLELKL
ncbi:TonB-dependent receptor plug domain-containing protein [Sphaerotilus mobilis]|uniref:Iron complex outermembrane receptor protein n=1 Tax=Sphaerotilus mobilis TaxID=47994 RepID=A0A4Q7LT30_9BURK|nr:TonB-dependent receptor [Sphaerotilus mobilis]RZS58046.1 iron complex outermembrane receptor protein [Sphaerotilus mobilis]